MSRRSPRLQSTGYYDPEGGLEISYKEKLSRIFRKHKTPSKPQKERETLNSVENFDFNIEYSEDSTNLTSDSSLNKAMFGHSNTDTLDINERHNTGRLGKNYEHSSDRKSQRSTMFNLKNLGFLFFVLSLCSGLKYFSTESQHFQFPVLSTPNNKDMNAAYEVMAEQLRHLQDELQSLKTEMKVLRPKGNTVPDFALGPQGASIVHDLTSETYYHPENSLRFFGIPLFSRSVNPYSVIQGRSELVPGNCWSFKGSTGHLVIALSHPIAISHVSLGHMSKTLSPTGTITSAPKEFTVYGMETEADPGSKLGRFLYDEDGDQLQTFNIPSHGSRIFKYVKLQVENNWGNPDYSCLYSFKVHGKMAE